MDATDFDPYGLLTAGYFTLTLAGMWEVTGCLGMSLNSVGAWTRAYVKWNDRNDLAGSVMSSIASFGGTAAFSPTIRKVAVGATVMMGCDSSAGIPVRTGIGMTWLSVHYLGTG
jgi:hypothetical protein